MEQDLVLRLEVVIQPALRQLQSSGHVVHRGGVIALLLKEARGGAQYLLTGFNGRFAVHHQRWYRGNGWIVRFRSGKIPVQRPETHPAIAYKNSTYDRTAPSMPCTFGFADSMRKYSF